MAILATLCVVALPALAADAVWQGGASGSWGSAYTDNWNGYPSSANAAVFGEPADTPITVQVDEAVAAKGVVSADGRTAGINFTGNGTLTNHGGTLLEFRGSPVAADWDVNIVNKANPTSIYGTNSFHKTVDCSGIDKLYLQSNSKVTMCDSASLTGVRVYVQPGAALEFLNSSTMTSTKDLTVYPGASLKVAGNTVLAPRGISLPFSKEVGVSDGWTLDGGTLCLTNSSGYAAAAGRSLDFPFTNATKTVSGSGTIQIYNLDCSAASNSTLRIDGPDLYIRSIGGNANLNNVLNVRGGSTLGAWGPMSTSAHTRPNSPVLRRWTRRTVSTERLRAQ